MELTLIDFECGWRGSVPYETLGPNNHPGKSVRVTTFKTLQGIFNFSEIVRRIVKRPFSMIKC